MYYLERLKEIPKNLDAQGAKYATFGGPDCTYTAHSFEFFPSFELCICINLRTIQYNYEFSEGIYFNEIYLMLENKSHLFRRTFRTKCP